MSPGSVSLARPLELAGGAALLGVLVFGCGEAIETPFYGEGQASSTGGTAAGGASGTAGAALGGTGTVAGSGMGGSAVAGSDSGGAGGDTGGSSGSGGVGEAGSPVGGTSGIAGAGGGTGPLPDCSGIALDAVGFDGHCYLLRETPSTFVDAREDCNVDGGHIVTISSEGRTHEQFLAENAFVWQLGRAMEQWIGATDGKAPHEPGDGTFYTWITGEPMPDPALDLWSSGQPNNSLAACQENAPCSCGDSCYEHCAFQWGDNGEWNDRLCEHLLPYVCEWDTPPSPSR